MQAPRTHAIASRTYICVARRVEYERGLVEDARPSPRPLLLALKVGHVASNPTIRTRQLVTPHVVKPIPQLPHQLALALDVIEEQQEQELENNLGIDRDVPAAAIPAPDPPRQQ